MAREISNSDDLIDSRDVIARIEALESELEDACTGQSEHNVWGDEWLKATADDDSHTMQDGALELIALRELAEEAADYAPDWEYGATLVRESYFVDYCQELLEDIGDLPKGLPAYLAIDWEKTADNLKVDYTEVDFDGVTYLVR